MHATTPLKPPIRPEPYAQVELLLLFHPSLQTGAQRASPEACARATQGWITLDVYGMPALSELTGRPVMEDMRLEAHGEDIEHLLPDGIVNEVADYLLRDE